MTVYRSSASAAGGLSWAEIQALMVTDFTGADEWGTDHDFEAGGSGDSFNGWTYTVGGAALPLARVCRFLAGVLEMEATGNTSGNISYILMTRDIALPFPLAMLGQMRHQYHIDCTGTTGGAGGADAHLYCELRDAVGGGYRIRSDYEVQTAGGTQTKLSTNLNTAGLEDSGYAANNWIGAALNTMLVHNGQATSHFHDVAVPGRFQANGRMRNNVTDTDPRCWPDPAATTLRVELRLSFDTGSTRHLEAHFDEGWLRAA